MRTKLKLLWLYVTFCSLVAGPLFVSWQIKESRNPELASNMLTTAEELQKKKNYDGAAAVYDFVIEQGLDEDQQALKGRIALDREMNSWVAKARDLAGGFLVGNIENTSSMIGCIAGDLTGWGDFRDLVRSSYHYYRGQEVDTIITTLAGLGLATTILPNIDVGLSVTKNFCKFMTTGVRQFLHGLLMEAKTLGNSSRVTRFMSDIGGMYKTIGGGVVDVFQFAQDSQQLMRVVHIVRKQGRSAYAVLLLGGKQGLRFLDGIMDLGVSLTGKAGKKLLTFGLKYPAMGLRIAKISKKIGFDHADLALVAMAELLGGMPLEIIAGIGLLLWCWIHLMDFLQLAWEILTRRPISQNAVT
jgi:hypothetical protein